jgi:hypothetical protein
MVDDQTANQSAKPLKKAKKNNNNKKILVLEQQNYSLSCSGVFPSAYTLSVSPRQVWSLPVAGTGQTGDFWACRAEAQQSCDLAGLLCSGLVGLRGKGPVEQRSGGPSGREPGGAVALWDCRAGAWRAQGVGVPVVWSSGSVGLWGRGLVGQPFF